MKGFGLFFTLFICFYGVAQQLPNVQIDTELGIIVVEIDTIRAPVTAKNFIRHVKAGTYCTAVFYRVVRMDNQPENKVKIEVIQGGIYSDEEIEKQISIPHETTEMTGLKHLNGTISMARYTPGTASTEFFICVGNQPELDFDGTRNPDKQGFAAFGHVTEGMDVVKKIQLLKDENQYLSEPLKITGMTIIK